MKLIRKILAPLALLYWIITFIRNKLYDYALFKSHSFSTPIIAVGNLSVGGTGKTPQIEYLIRLFSNKYKVAVLSRGYKRATKGFILADEQATSQTIGDEPFQYYSKFKNIKVAVDANRVNGITNLLKNENPPDLILLDDAYQHRKVKAGFYLLLTAFDDLFCDDFILPFGNLRESALGKNRANLIIVTKTPKNISETQKKEVINKLNCMQPIFFSTIEYDELVYNNYKSHPVSTIKEESKLVLAGIAKPSYFFDFIANSTDELVTFPDHHAFSKSDCESILMKANGKKIITTEKDYTRLKEYLPKEQLFYLPIKANFTDSNIDLILQNYVEQNTRNR